MKKTPKKLFAIFGIVTTLVFNSSCIQPKPQVGPVVLTKTLSSVSTTNNDWIIEPDTYATLLIRPTKDSETQEFITQLQLKGEGEICTVEPPGTLLNPNALKFSRRILKVFKETSSQAEISSHRTLLPCPSFR